MRHSIESAYTLIVDLMRGHGLELREPRRDMFTPDADDERVQFNIRESRG